MNSPLKVTRLGSDLEDKVRPGEVSSPPQSCVCVGTEDTAWTYIPLSQDYPYCIMCSTEQWKLLIDVSSVCNLCMILKGHHDCKLTFSLTVVNTLKYNDVFRVFLCVLVCTFSKSKHPPHFIFLFNTLNPTKI